MTYRALVVQAAEAVERELAGLWEARPHPTCTSSESKVPTRRSGLQVRSMRNPSPPDTTTDTTQSATRSNGGQPPARESAWISRYCNPQQPVATDVVRLWLRRSRVRVHLAPCPVD